RDGTASGSPYGGGVSVRALTAAATAKVTLDHVVLRENHAGTGGGAAVQAWVGIAELVIKNSLIEANIAGEGGGLAAVADLGGVAKIRLESSTVLGNEAQEWPDSEGWGGALYANSIREGTADIDLVNSILAQNTSESGGIYVRSGYCDGCHDEATTDVDLLNTTVTDNGTPGIVARSWDQGQTTVSLVNSIAWGNSYNEIDAIGDSRTTEITAWYSDVGRTEMGFNATYNPIGGMLDTDPFFVEPSDGYHLGEASDLIDAGICGLFLPGPYGPIYARIAPALDMDDDLRPPPEELWGCDIGADEYVPFERWVRPGGSDVGNSCSDSAVPCGTIQHAIDEAISAGGHYKTVVHLTTGTYLETVSITDPPSPVILQGGWSSDFTTRQVSGFDTVIDANGLGAALTYEDSDGKADLEIESLTLTDGWAQDGGGLSFRCTLGYGHLDLAWVVVDGNHAADSGGGVQIRPVACNLEADIWDTMVTDNSATGVGGGVRFRIDDASTLVGRIRSITVAGNEAGYGGGLVFQQTGSGKGWLFLDSSVLALNLGAVDAPDDLWIEELGSDFVYVSAEHSDIPAVTQWGGLYLPEPSVIAVNPGFADPAGGDFHLTPYSSVLGLGACLPGQRFDCDGELRPATDCDMGADEYLGGWVPPLDLWITQEVLSGWMVREACRSVTAGPEVLVQAGAVELRAGEYLALGNGFEVAADAALTATLYRPPSCP
ncbi:MAG: hypothetical protein GY769_02025, partial [bacterium]|nr:hypothetical protein [bacterium]